MGHSLTRLGAIRLYSYFSHFGNKVRFALGDRAQLSLTLCICIKFEVRALACSVSTHHNSSFALILQWPWRGESMPQ